MAQLDFNPAEVLTGYRIRVFVFVGRFCFTLPFVRGFVWKAPGANLLRHLSTG